MSLAKLKKALYGTALDPTPASSATRVKGDILTELYDYLKAKHNKVLPYVPKPSHSPSSLSTECLRKIYYAYFKVEKDKKTDAKGARIFETGLSYETMLMTWFIDMGFHIPYRNKDGSFPKDKDDPSKNNVQFPIKIDDFRIRKGFIDNVLVINGELWLMEFKSSNENKFFELNDVMEDHKTQTACYYKAFDEHLQNGDFAHIPELAGFNQISGIMVVYINKNNSDLKLFSLDREALQANLDRLAVKVAQVNEYIDKKQLPPCSPDKCKYCPYQKKCKINWNDV